MLGALLRPRKKAISLTNKLMVALYSSVMLQQKTLFGATFSAP